MLIGVQVPSNRAKPKFLDYLMGDFPKHRVTPSRPFLNTLIDYFGSFWIHLKIRQKCPHKAYIAVFCCFSTKAIYMELVNDLSTAKCIQPLNRFIGRRCRYETIYCENATKFNGATKKLKEFQGAVFAKKNKI